jgi:hypothetical protein
MFAEHRLVMQDVFGASIGNAHCEREKKTMFQVAAFCLFVRTSPNNIDLLGGNGNTLK